MKLENTPENKAKFFALYWGQKVAMYKTDQSIKLRIGSPVVSIEHIDRLELTPLSQISDEDAIELIKMQFDYLPEEFKISEFNRSYKNIPSFTYSFIDKNDFRGFSEMSLLHGSKDYYGKMSIEQFKYAVSKAYYVGDGTEIEYGWVKLKEV